MKTAILLATQKNDKLDVKVIEHGPYSDVLGEFKRRTASGDGEPGYDTLEIWTGPPAKKYSRFGRDETEFQGAPPAGAKAPAPEGYLPGAQAETADASASSLTPPKKARK